MTAEAHEELHKYALDILATCKTREELLHEMASYALQVPAISNDEALMMARRFANYVWDTRPEAPKAAASGGDPTSASGRAASAAINGQDGSL